MTSDAEQLGVIQRSPENATVRFERSFAAPPADVWRALTEPQDLSAWLSPATVDLRVSGRVEITFDDGQITGSITELEAERVLEYTWHEAGSPPSLVRWEIEPGESGTRVTLTHTRLPLKPASGFAAGWHHHLERLAAVLGGEALEWSNARFEDLHAKYSAGPDHVEKHT